MAAEAKTQAEMDVATALKRIVIDMLEEDPPRIVKDSDRLVEDLGFDSLDAVNLLMNIEEEFGVEIEDSDVLGLETVKEWISYLMTRQ